MNVGVDETGKKVPPGQIHGLSSLVAGSETGYDPVSHHHVHPLDLTREDVCHLAVGKEEIGRGISPGHLE
jgi:hypothetical protein